VLLTIFVIVSLVIFAFSTVYALSTFGLIAISVYEALHQRIERGPGYSPPHRLNRPGISLIVPAYNEEKIIVGSIRSMLALDYEPLEIVIVDDGSTDGMLQTIDEAFRLTDFPVGDRIAVESKPVEAKYVSTIDPRLRVMRKQNGGRADAINAGIGAATQHLVALTDADSLFDRDALKRASEPFIAYPDQVVGSGGSIWVANGSTIEDGRVVEAGIPRGPTAATQVGEYLRAFFGTRIAWASMNGLPILSGAFGVYRRDLLLSLGGLSTDTLGEDMELTLRVHHLLRPTQPDTRIAFAPDAVCWTEVPSGLRALRGQRVRWHVGLLDNIRLHRAMLGRRRYGAVGWGSLPHNVLFEAIAPLVEVTGIIIMIVLLAFGSVNWPYAIAFFLVMALAGQLQTAGGILIQDVGFPRYKIRDIVRVGIWGVLEIFWYQPLTAVWRVWATFLVLIGRRPGWGTIPRGAALHEEPREPPTEAVAGAAAPLPR